MNASNDVMAQAEIDALLSAQPPAPDLPKVVPVSFASTPKEPPTSADNTMPGAVAKLTERIDALEAALKKTGQVEQAVSQTSLAVQQLQQSLQALAQHVQAVSAAIQAISANLEATPGYGLRKTFVCRSCGTKGFLAARTKCTHCGQESWVGWSPPRK